MATQKDITSVSMTDIGVRMEVPKDKLEEVSVILRCILALSDGKDTNQLIQEGESYEYLVRRLTYYVDNLNEIAETVREITGYAQ